MTKFLIDFPFLDMECIRYFVRTLYTFLSTHSISCLILFYILQLLHHYQFFLYIFLYRHMINICRNDYAFITQKFLLHLFHSFSNRYAIEICYQLLNAFHSTGIIVKRHINL